MLYTIQTLSNLILHRLLLLTVAVAVASVGCASVSSHQGHHPAGAISAEEQNAARSVGQLVTGSSTTIPSESLERQLRSLVRQWEGTPHRLGGTSSSGIDCSGFVQLLYRDYLNRQIPRSTTLQVKSGRPVDKDQLRSGDLVFFKIPDKKQHVGIYLGQADFAHASASRGVTISSLGNPYWQNAYWTARRYLGK